jgi:hypothetical protein
MTAEPYDSEERTTLAAVRCFNDFFSVYSVISVVQQQRTLQIQTFLPQKSDILRLTDLDCQWLSN